jgi:hypothetical protein
MVGLFDIAILMGYTRVVPRGLHAVVLHECLIAGAPLLAFFRPKLVDGSAQVIGPVLLRHTAHLPECLLQPLRQRFKALALADGDGFHIRVRENKVEEPMGKGFPGQGNCQVVHPGKIRLAPLAWRVLLGKDDLTVRPVQRAPGRDVSLQRAQLGRTIPPRMARTQQGKQGGALQGRITFKVLDHPGPILLEGIRARAPGMWCLELAGQFARSFVFAGRALAHASAGRREPLRSSFVSLLHIQLDLGILLHDPISFARNDEGHGRACSGPPSRSRPFPFLDLWASRVPDRHPLCFLRQLLCAPRLISNFRSS